MNKKAQEFIRKKKRKKALRKLAVAIFIFIIALVIFIYKSSIFNLKTINFEGIITLNEEELQENLREFNGKNIFTINYDKIKSKIKQNPYISEVSVEKDGVNSLNITIKENKIAFYIEDGETKNIINNDLVLVEKVPSIEGRNLVKLLGIKAEVNEIGKKIIDNNHLTKILNDFYPIIENMPKEHKLESIDVADITNIKTNIENVKIFLGDTENLVDKMNLVLNAIDQGAITKGYIDLSFDGPPVIKEEN